MDDIFNFIPARLSALCIIAGAGMLRLDNRSALRIYRRDRNLHKSPNAGQTESACGRGAAHPARRRRELLRENRQKGGVRRPAAPCEPHGYPRDDRPDERRERARACAVLRGQTDTSEVI